MKSAASGMRRTLTVIIVFWFGVVAACAPVQAADPAIWRVEGGPEPVWLFGTFHLLPPVTDWKRPRIVSAFESADVLVVEVHLDGAANAAAQKLIAEKAILKGDRKLRDYLGPKDRAALEKIGNRLGLFPAILDNYRPWYASILLAVAIYYEQGYRPDAGVDTVLQKRAEATGKTVEQLETVEEQLNFLADMPEKVQVAMLQATLREAEMIPKMMDEMLRAWETGDTRAMDKMLNAALREQKVAYDTLLVQRNRNWVPRIEEMIRDDKSYFIAVGAAHLVGKDSVVAMLRAKGYRVTGP